MNAYPAWTPAARPGIIPLHPLGFGTILGRSFAALRQNPRVLLGFALGVQALAYLVLLLVVGAVALASFSRLDTLQPGTEDYDAVLAGSFALTAITGLGLGLAASALSVIVQGIVVTEVSRAIVAEKLRLREIWRRLKPAAWRLIGYALLVGLAVLLVVALVVALLVALGAAALPAAILVAVLAVLAAIPLAVWLATKLVLVPAVIILENAGIGSAMARSWHLTRGRFWTAFGVMAVINLTFGTLAQVVGIPMSLLTGALTTVVSPTGDPEPTALIGVVVVALFTQVLTLVVQCIAIIVQSTASALLYVDCRMRHEGLDLDLQAYVERRDAGVRDLPDPYRAHVGRRIDPRPVFASPPPYPPPAPSAASPPRMPAPPRPPDAAVPPAPAPARAEEPVAPHHPAPTQWTAPGSPDESAP